jgi:hypothetical protein
LADAFMRVEYDLLTLNFSEPRGTGHTVYEARVSPENFTDLARAMMQSDPDAAMRAFGEALRNGLPERRDVWIPDMAA